MTRKRRSVTEAAAGGSRVEALEALRDLLAESLAEAEPGQRAALAKQLRETMAELASLPDAAKRSTSDDLAARRSARRAGTKAADPTVGSKLERPGSG